MTVAASLPWDDRAVRVTLPMRTISENNAREAWQARARRRKYHRETTALVVGVHLRTSKVAPPYVVTLTRVAPRKLDGDNLQGALKAVRDGVADALGIDDGSDRVEWRYGQAKGALVDPTLALGYGVEIRIEAL